MIINSNSIGNFFKIISEDKKEIYSIYFYSVFYGLVQLSLPIGIQSIISFVLAGTISTSLVLLIILVVVGVLISGMVQVNQLKIIEKIQQKLMVRYAFLYAHRLPKIDLRSVDNYYMPELVNRFFDTISLQKSISKLLIDVPAATIQILFGLILLSVYHQVFIFFGITLIAVLFLIIRLSAERGMQTSLEESNYKYKIAGYIEEIARALQTFKFSNNRKFHIGKVDALVEGYLQSRTAHFRVLMVQYWALIVFKVLITASMLIVGAFLLIEQQLNIGQFIAAEIVILLVISSVEKLIVNLDKVYDVLTSVEKINKVLEKPLENSGNAILAPDDKGLAVTLKDVSFGYNSDHLIINNVSMDIGAGEKIIISGDQGSGKSTLLKLMNGSLHSHSGRIEINRLPLAQYDLNNLRSKMGNLFAHPELFEGTLLENITLGNAEIPVHKILELADRLQLASFIDGLPQGLNTQLLPAGSQLSGRTIKKILLLRALIHATLLLILDDPFAGLTSEVRSSLKQYILEELPNTTVIIASNDIEAESNFDKQYSLKNGMLFTTK